jgi:uncharacterized 2Fe-2S/4Fe-4S cluster protein (DUF4445 family)
MQKNKMGTTYRLLFEPMGRSCDAGEDQTILESAQRLGIDLRTDCGGKGQCGKCRILSHPKSCLSSITQEERKHLTPRQLDEGYRLACQAKPVGPGTISVPQGFLDSNEAVGKTRIKGTFPVESTVERICLGPPSRVNHKNGESRDLVTRTIGRVRAMNGKHIFFKDAASIRELSQPFVSQSAITLVSHATKGVTGVLPGEHRKSLGIAVDVGTTTIAVYLCDLQTGDILSSEASANPQRRFGEDVISRVAFANAKENGAQTLHRLVIDEIEHLSAHCLEKLRAHRRDVDEITVVGNTTMEHLFAGFHPHSLGVSPYLPVQRFPDDLNARDLKLNFNPGTNVHLFPVVSGFVGGDTMGVILSEKPYQRGEISLIVDIGTNGEVVLGNREKLWVTSCATGPALEGAQIECGMRASSGAIHRVEIEPSTCNVTIGVLGEEQGASPKGLCGSGIIDAAAEMGRSGVLLPSGRIKEGMPGVICDERGVGRRFLLTSQAERGLKKSVYISLSDIRQVQLAKGALSAGIKLLMRKAGITRIDRMVLTGAFGARFNWRNAVSIGMLPRPSSKTCVKTVENAAGIGAVMALLDRSCREELRNLAGGIQFVELAEEPDFAVEFPMAMGFPFGDGETNAC